MQSFSAFKSTRRLKIIKDKDTWCYGTNHGWQITETYPDDKPTSVFTICGEEFETLEKAEHALYQMYCDEEMLYEDWH